MSAKSIEAQQYGQTNSVPYDNIPDKTKLSEKIKDKAHDAKEAIVKGAQDIYDKASHMFSSEEKLEDQKVKDVLDSDKKQL